MKSFAPLTMAVLIVCCFGGPAAVWAQQSTVFYDNFETGDTTAWWAPARVGETGQLTCYNAAGESVSCVGSGQDGERQAGVPWPVPRFVDNLDGTVTDMLTGVIWLKNASCFGPTDWATALASVAALSSSSCGLNDGSTAGEWSLPTVNQLQSLVAYGFASPALADGAGTSAWSEGDAFSAVVSSAYWSSTSDIGAPQNAWTIDLTSGSLESVGKGGAAEVWPMRAGQLPSSGPSGYGDCASQPEEEACTAEELCLSDAPTDPTVAVCTEMNCTSTADCALAPPTGTAPVICADVNGDMSPDCMLDCSSGQVCPDGMSCFMGFLCVWPVTGFSAEPDHRYGDFSPTATPATPSSVLTRGACGPG